MKWTTQFEISSKCDRRRCGRIRAHSSWV